MVFCSAVIAVRGTARSRREQEPGEPQESGFSPKKSESSARNFTATLFMAKYSARTKYAEKVLISTFLIISRLVTLRSRITTAFTFAMTWSFRLVEDRPEHGSFSFDVRLSLNRLYRSLIRVTPVVSSPESRLKLPNGFHLTRPVSDKKNFSDSTSNFPYDENNFTRTLNTISLKCYLPSTDAIDNRGKIHTRVCIK